MNHAIWPRSDMRGASFTRLASLVLTVVLAASSAGAETSAKQRAGQKSGYGDDEDFGGPASVEGQLEEDDRVKQPVLRFPAVDRILQPWFDWKRRLHDELGLDLGFDYNVLYQSLDDALPGDDNAAMVVSFVIYGTWALINRGTDREGVLFFKIEHRDDIGTDIAPAELAGQAGYIGVTGLNFSDAGLILADLNWQQRLGRRAGLIVGRYDPNDYMNVLGYVNPWSHFSNLSVSLDTSLALAPDDVMVFGLRVRLSL